MQPSNTSTVLVAVKQKPNSEVHEQLNRNVVALAQRISGALEAELHAVTVYKGMTSTSIVRSSPTVADLPRNRVHSTEGSASRGIAEVAEKLNAGVIVIGSANSVFGPSRADTAQRVIDEVTADVIVLPAVG
jgi:nucleotide-binding universal stress UspA family protein